MAIPNVGSSTSADVADPPKLANMSYVTEASLVAHAVPLDSSIPDGVSLVIATTELSFTDEEAEALCLTVREMAEILAQGGRLNPKLSQWRYTLGPLVVTSFAVVYKLSVLDCALDGSDQLTVPPEESLIHVPGSVAPVVRAFAVPNVNNMR
jgi:hypothetical protein